MRRSPRAIRACAIAVYTALGVGACSTEATSARRTAADPAQALSRTPAPGFERITEPRDLVFPDDYGPHPETQTEWWYITGNLTTDEGREFGYQFTIFRLGVVPPGATSDSSAWAAGDLYMAHAALTDLEASRFVASQRLTRPALGLAGAQASPFRVWLEGWALASRAEGSFFPLSLTAGFEGGDRGEDEVVLDLVLDDGKPLVLQGDRGYSRKGDDAADASLYYSFTKLPTRGSITANGERFEVSGSSWLDREWSTSVLSRSQRGWDWFALQLLDGRELMLFELRADDPEATVRDATLVNADGTSTRVELNSETLRVLDTWASPIDGARYPSAWALLIPDHDLDLRIISAYDNQEHSEVFRYWEGAVRVFGPEGARAGVGYAELTGYGKGGVP